MAASPVLAQTRGTFFGMNRVAGGPPTPQSFGFDFRGTLIYVTDPADCQCVLGESYPQTTTINGFSVTWGWVPSGSTAGCGSCTAVNIGNADDMLVTPKLAGINNSNASVCSVFRVHLPASGSYTFRAAFGNAIGIGDNTVDFYDSDGTTNLFNVASAVVTLGGQWIDATGVTRTSDTDWVNNNAPKTLTISGTDVFVAIGNNTGFVSLLSHLFVTQN